MAHTQQVPVGPIARHLASKKKLITRLRALARTIDVRGKSFSHFAIFDNIFMRNEQVLVKLVDTGSTTFTLQRSFQSQYDPCDGVMNDVVEKAVAELNRKWFGIAHVSITLQSLPPHPRIIFTIIAL